MNFRDMAAKLKAAGYSPRKADAKVAHDLVLKAIEAAGFHDKVTIKGGVVMSGITDEVRRATMDMDFDFLGYSLGDVPSSGSCSDSTEPLNVKYKSMAKYRNFISANTEGSGSIFF